MPVIERGFPCHDVTIYNKPIVWFDLDSIGHYRLASEGKKVRGNPLSTGHYRGKYALNWISRAWIDIFILHYSDVIMSAMASQVTSLTIVYSTVYSSTDQRKHQSSASLAFVRGIHWWPVNSPHKGPVARKMFPFDDVIMPPTEAFASTKSDYPENSYCYDPQKHHYRTIMTNCTHGFSLFQRVGNLNHDLNTHWGDYVAFMKYKYKIYIDNSVVLLWLLSLIVLVCFILPILRRVPCSPVKWLWAAECL